MSELRAGMTGFDITPRFHPTCGAWGTTPEMTEVDMPLLGRCLVLEQNQQRLIWFSADLVGDSPRCTDRLRDEVAEALGMSRDQILWGTTQNHSSGAPPWSQFTGAVIADLSNRDEAFAQREHQRVVSIYVEAAREAIERLQPASVWAGRGYCDSVSFNTRFPLPTGQLKYCRHHDEAALGGRPIDPTIGLVRFDDAEGKPIGALFNFNMHPATMINQKMISPDWVGTARQCLEDALDGAPVLYCQGFCSDINCYHMFGTPEQARQTGARLGEAAVAALPALVPVRSQPLAFLHKTIHLRCHAMPTREQLEAELAELEKFIEDVKDDPKLIWCLGANLPQQFSVEEKIRFAEYRMEYRRAGLRLLAEGNLPSPTLPITLGAVRIGDVAAVLSPGENFAETGIAIRRRSPFVHTLICGDVNGLFGNIFTDEDIRRGGYAIDSYFEILSFDGFRLPPGPGSAQQVIETCVELLWQLHRQK